MTGVCTNSEEDVAVSPKTCSSQVRIGKRRSKTYREKKSPYEGVIFVPSTPGSKLWKELQVADDKFTKVQGIKSIKFVERGGTALSELLVKSNPFKPVHCGREKCWPCNGPMSTPSDIPTPSGGPDTIVIIINNVQGGESRTRRRGSRDEGQRGAKCQDSEEACTAVGVTTQFRLLYQLTRC